MDARAPSMAGLPPERELTPLSMVVRNERIGAWLPLKVLLSSLDDGLELVDPPTVEHEGEGAEGVLDARCGARRAVGNPGSGDAGTGWSRRSSRSAGSVGACSRMYSSPSGSSKRTWAVVPDRQPDGLLDVQGQVGLEVLVEMAPT